MLSYTKSVLVKMEQDFSIFSRDGAFFGLRQLGLDDFGEVLLLMPLAEFPRLSAILPHMSSPEVQNLWTGNNGYVLLRQTCAFVRSVSYNYNLITGNLLSNATILDYGCGYGRIARLMYYFVNSDRLVGVDPWIRSIEECQTAMLGPQFRQSDYLPTSLPVNGQKFDLAYAFSVFTHLSERATLMALAAVRQSMTLGGVFCITIRPPEYWETDASSASPTERQQMKNTHEAEGFAFFPHRFADTDGEQTYGDTSLSLGWLQKATSEWHIARIDRSLEDPYQIYVFLRAA